MSGADRTEAPTPKRRREARREGRIPRSTELVTWSAVLAGTYLVPLVAVHSGRRLRALLAQAERVASEPDAGGALRLLGTGLRDAALVVAPLTLGLMALGVATNLVQVGFAPSGKLVAPKLERINPFKGLKRLLSPQSVWEAAKTLMKTALLTLLVLRSMRDVVPALVDAGRMPVPSLVSLLAARALALARSVALAGLVLAALDYSLQRRRVAKGLRMTKQEVREENRQAEGDPHLRGAIRSRQLAMSRNRMMSEISGADVVLVNPTHVAVALRYDPARGAPRVVAKGAGETAARIRAEADRARVPMVEDVPLARAVYRACELGQEIPADLYDAVARVLAFIFSLRSRGAAAGLHRVPGPLVTAGRANGATGAGRDR
ncbi:MAG: EscU/YscU/HrcU family type III secretion system export apparatus switch protein [Actinomycetota bacterium]|nr:EscU/YscU/HrcU family type III secretion system export apparatus switch protein [Actinomycetota bacterium]